MRDEAASRGAGRGSGRGPPRGTPARPRGPRPCTLDGRRDRVGGRHGRCQPDDDAGQHALEDRRPGDRRRERGHRLALPGRRPGQDPAGQRDGGRPSDAPPVPRARRRALPGAQPGRGGRAEPRLEGHGAGAGRGDGRHPARRDQRRALDGALPHRRAPRERHDVQLRGDGVKIAYVLYPDFTALDLVGPYEVISRWPDAEVRFLASSLEPVRCDAGLTVLPTDTPESLPDPDLIVVPGSGNPVPVLDDHVLIEWLRAVAPGCQWTASVCTGAGLYAAAGLLEGKKTTTHWAFRDNLRAMGVEVVGDRVVWQGNHISGAGVSAGIDMALALTDRVHGRELAESLQLVIEYDPQPPFSSGSPDKADASTLRLAFRLLLGDRPLEFARRVNGHAATARFRLARRALAERPPH